MLKLVLAIIFLLGAQAQASSTNITISENLLVSLVADKVTLRVNALKNSNQLKIMLNSEAEAVFELVNEGQMVKIKPRSSLSFPFAGSNPQPSAGPVVELSGGSVPLDLKLRSGQVQINGWDKEIVLNIFSGSVLSKDGRGSLTILTQKAPVNIYDHVGKLIIDSYGGAVRLKNIEGDSLVESFLADVFFENVSGVTKLTSNQSAVRVSGGGGQLTLDMSRGSFNSQAFKGRMEGDARETQALVKMHQESDVNLKTKTGKLTVHAAPNSSPYVSLFTSEGEIFTPSSLKPQRDATGRFVRGRLRGGTGKGSIVLKAEGGVLSVQ